MPRAKASSHWDFPDNKEEVQSLCGSMRASVQVLRTGPKREGGADPTLHGTHDIGAEGLCISTADGAAREAPDLGFMFEGSPHL